MPEHKPPLIICNVCGTVESVTPIEREAAQGSGLGAIAGAALGGIVGNQFGGGTGKDLATIAGMVGGGFAGNASRKRSRKKPPTKSGCVWRTARFVNWSKNLPSVWAHA